MRVTASFFLTLFVYVAAVAEPVTDLATVEGHYTTVTVSPFQGCTVENFIFQASGINFAGADGLIQEGFGVGNYYLPNRRLNERLEAFAEAGAGPLIRYAYDCDGRNIDGIHVTRTMEPLPNEASIRVRWRLEHRGDETHWIAPWVRTDWMPGGKNDDSDRVHVPTLQGILDIEENAYFRASRNWVAATDPANKTTVYAVYDADHAFAYLVEREHNDESSAAVKTHFTPRRFAPGDEWETTYRVNVVRGLDHIDFATDEMAVQIDYASGLLQVRLASPTALPEMRINAVVVAPDGEIFELPARQFELDPNKVVRCTYEWTPPGDGAYDFLAQLTVGGQTFSLGAETGSPHGGIDTQFVVGARSTGMDAWTDATYALERGGRELRRDMAASGDVPIWFETSLNKIFREDKPVATGAINSRGRITLAKNEAESIQLVLHAPEDQPLSQVTLKANALVHESGRGEIPVENIAVHRTDYVPIRVPSYFEGPTGMWPDPLPALRTMNVNPGRSAPIWITVRTPKDIPAGEYRGLLELDYAGSEPVELWLEAQVYDFALPDTPALKTDFGFIPKLAADQAEAMGFDGAPESLMDAYLELALSNRINLRELSEFPSESADYVDRLEAYKPRLAALREHGAAALHVPPSLLDVPAQLKLANQFVLDNNLEGRVFTQIADEPPQPAWPEVYDRAQAWREHAPDIPILISTFGLQPFLTDAAHIWSVHSPMLDTTNNRTILEYPQDGGEIWWYVDHAPPRPYANFFIDFDAVEHRIFFWQTRITGFRGVQYWAVNFSPPGENPRNGAMDTTPVNGDGLLIYPGPDGPVTSIRLETLRDGVEDYDYLALLNAGLNELKERGGPEDLIQRAVAAGDLEDLVKSLVDFSRDPAVLEQHRHRIAETIEAIQDELE